MTETVSYNLAFPLAKKELYSANDTVDIILSLEKKKLIPGSLALSGYCVLLNNAANIAQGDNVQIDADAGYHSLFRDITTEFRNVGITENFSYYPRYVKMKTQCTKYRESLGTETYNCIEGKCPSDTVCQGYCYGQTGTGGFLPFVVKPDIAANKSDVPIPGDQVGTIRLRIRLAPNNEVIFGSDVTAAHNYKITDLKLHYETVPDDGTRPQINMEVYNVNRQVIETNSANLSTFVPGLSDAVHMSFIKVADELTDAANYLRCESLPGKAMRPTNGAGNSVDLIDPNNGAERLYYAINDTDTALVGFTMETRQEMLWNYLRSFNNEPTQHAVTVDRVDAPLSDAYGLGINFGAALDFSKQKFAADIDSQINVPYSCYMYFRSPVAV